MRNLEAEVNTLEQMLEELVAFAYEHGHHENGFPIVKEFRATITDCVKAQQPPTDP